MHHGCNHLGVGLGLKKFSSLGCGGLDCRWRRRAGFWLLERSRAALLNKLVNGCIWEALGLESQLPEKLFQGA